MHFKPLMLAAAVILVLVGALLPFAGAELVRADGAPAPSPSITGQPIPTEWPGYSRLKELTDAQYYYIARPNNVKAHPVPPEYQTSMPRDMHIQCLDWNRLPRSVKTAAEAVPSKFKYVITTCECWHEKQIPATPRPGAR